MPRYFIQSRRFQLYGTATLGTIDEKGCLLLSDSNNIVCDRDGEITMLMKLSRSIVASRKR